MERLSTCVLGPHSATFLLLHWHTQLSVSVVAFTSHEGTQVPQMQQEDPRYRILDRVLARAYVKLMHRWKTVKKRLETGFLVPRMDLCDDPENTHMVATLEVPDMRREELLLQVKDSRLIIEGERIGPHLPPRIQTPQSAPSSAAEASTPSSLYPIRELKYGKVRREIDLPAGVDVTQVHSVLAEGILTVSWPRVPVSPVGAGDSIVHPPTSI